MQNKISRPAEKYSALKRALEIILELLHLKFSGHVMHQDEDVIILYRSSLRPEN